MATRSRTYKSIDWQVWTYVPTPGVFRLDFSKWDDGSDWGSNGGSIAPIDLPISQIEIDEDYEPVFGISQIEAGTATVAFQIDGFDKSKIAEFYTGKPIYITLKNEETTRLHTVFGQNTPIFSGYISSVNFVFNKFDSVQTLVITVTDSMQYLLNMQLAVDKSSDKASSIRDAFYGMRSDQLLPIDCLFWQTPPYTYIGSDLPAGVSFTYEASGTESKSWGTWMQDLANTHAGRYIAAMPYFYSTNGSSEFIGYKKFLFQAANASNNSSFYPVMEIEKLISVNVGNSFPDKPSIFEVSTSSGLEYSFGESLANSTNQVITYNGSFNSPFSDLAPLVTAMLANKNWIAPTELKFEIARENQQITFKNDKTGMYLFPHNLAQCGDAINLDLTDYGFESVDSYAYVTGRNISITKDNILATYKIKRTE